MHALKNPNLPAERHSILQEELRLLTWFGILVSVVRLTVGLRC